jgi:hypothetical protein
MKRHILRVLGVCALATGGLLAVAGAAHADSGSSNGNRFTYLYQHDTVICGNAIAVKGFVQNFCGGRAGTHPADLDHVDGFFDLDLDFSGDSAEDDAGQWFHIDSRTWS